jgi:hypothetical protein
MILSAVTSAEPVFLRTKKASEEKLDWPRPPTLNKHLLQLEGRGREVGWGKQASLRGLARR